MLLGMLGWPRSGKTTLFNALTRLQSASSGSPSATHTAVVRIPDSRIDQLTKVFSPKKTTYAEVTFVDPAGDANPVVERPSFPDSLLEEINGADALVLVIRAFENPAVIRPPGSKDAAADLLSLEQELILRDLDKVEKRLKRLKKEGKNPNAAQEKKTLEKCNEQLMSEKNLRALEWDDMENAYLRGFQFLTMKPFLVVLNVDEDGLGAASDHEPADRADRPVLRLCAKIEQELGELEDEEAAEFIEQLGIGEPARDVFIRGAYRLLDLISFFTVGEDEVRAWPVRRNSPAPVAAGKIHSDLQKGFIRAEVIHYEDFIRVGSLTEAKSQGLLRLEGKSYNVQDGDIMHVRHA